MKRLKLAWCSPLGPQKSGIADYSEELLPYMRELADVDLVVGGYQPANHELKRLFRIRHIDELAADASAYDAIIYQVGNNLHHHGYMFPCLRSVPGIVVLHDYCLQYLMLGLTLGQGELTTLERILAPNHGGDAGAIARGLLFGSIDPDTISFAGPLVELSRFVIVHSEYARQCVVRDFPAKRVRVVRMGVPIDAVRSNPAPLRARYGLRDQDFVVASVTSLVSAKRLPLILDSVRALRRQVPTLRLVVAGGGSPGKDARRSMADLERAGILVRTGWVAPQDYKDIIAMADVIVDMRYPSGAETSASLTRALAAGKPLIVSAHGASREIPDECSIKIAVGDGEGARLEEAIRELAGNADRRRHMAHAARQFAESNLRLDQAACAYIDCVQDALLCPAPLAPDVWRATGGSAARRLLVASAYKLFRVRHLQRSYGTGHALRRICAELRTAVHLGSA